MRMVITVLTAIYLIAGIAMVLIGIVAVLYKNSFAWINFLSGGFVIIDAVIIFYRLRFAALR